MKNISAKLVRVMQACDYVQKLGKNDFHRYKYAMAADVLEKVNEALVKNNVASFAVPELVNMVDVTNAKGNTEHLATVKMNVTLIDADSGESIQVVGLGSGQDVGDKAIMKAQTAALKYCWMLTLNISTGDDPEADNTVDERMNVEKVSTKQPVQQKTELASEAQCKAIFAKGNILGMDNGAITKALSKQYGVTKVDELTKKQASEVLQRMNEAAAKKEVAATETE